jgi:hypothetical protein
VHVQLEKDQTELKKNQYLYKHHDIIYRLEWTRLLLIYYDST